MASKILWLCSWYPNQDFPFDGDFIQRHADAVSQVLPIEVLYTHKDEKPDAKFGYEKINRNSNLIEHRYNNPVQKQGFIAKIIGLFRYVQVHLQHIKKHGKPDLIHVQIPMKAGLIALWCKWRFKIPYIVTEHYGIYNPHLDNHFKTRNLLYQFCTKLIIKNANQLTTVSHSLGNDMNQWVVQKPFTVIPNVVDTTLFHFEPPVEKDRFQFIHISNMIPLKNVKGIIESTELLWKQRQDFKMVFVGKIVDEFHQLAESKNLINNVIFFEGELPYEQVSQKIKKSDAMIIFSDTESQSCVVLESLCCGRPAIVTNIGGVKELIDESNGYKVNVRDTADLVQSMNKMMNEYSKFSLQQISANAISKYAYSQVAEQFLSCYKRVGS